MELVAPRSIRPVDSSAVFAAHAVIADSDGSGRGIAKRSRHVIPR